MANETTNYEITNEVVETAVKTKSVEPSATTESETAKASETTSTNIGTVKAAKLNIREKPFKAAKVVSVVPKGEKLMINGERSNEVWYCVMTKDGTRGYCMKEFVTVLK